MKKILVLILFVFFNILSLTAQEREYFEFPRHYKNDKMEKIWIRDETMLRNINSLLNALHKFNLYMLPHCTLGIGRIKYKIKDIRSVQNLLNILGEIAKLKKVSEIKSYLEKKGIKSKSYLDIRKEKRNYNTTDFYFEMGILTAHTKTISSNDTIQALAIDFWNRMDCNCAMMDWGMIVKSSGFHTTDLTLFYDVLEYMPFEVDLVVNGFWTLRYFWIDKTLELEKEKIKAELNFIQ